MTGSKTNNPLKKKSTLFVIVVLVLGAALALISWLIFGNVFQLGIITGFSIAGILWSFGTGLFVGRRQRQFLWFAGILVLLGATVVGLIFFDLVGYVLGSSLALLAFCIFVAGAVLGRRKKTQASDDE